MRNIILKKIFFCFFVLASGIFLSGCIGNFQGESKKQTNEFVKGTVVSGFPNVPRYPEMQAIESFGNGKEYGAVFLSKDETGKILKFYSESLPLLSWEHTLEKQSETYYSFKIRKNNQQGEIIVNTASDGKSSAVSVFVSAR